MRKALVIGVDNYQATLTSLNGCTNDATRLCDLLSEDKYGFLVKKLVDGEATRLKVRQNIQWCLADSDFSIIYFAGHGVRTDVATYLATFDYEQSDEGVDVAWLQSAVAKLTSADSTCLVILDCCHSGDAKVRTLAPELRDISPSDLPAISGAGRALLAACKADQKASEYSENGKTFGLFSHHLCNAIQGHAANDQGIVSVNAVYDYIAIKLSEAGQQVPVFRGDFEGQIILATDINPLGLWRPKSTSNPLSAEEATDRAERLLSQILPKVAPSSHTDWQQKGYKEACQAFEPVLEWFERRRDTQPELMQARSFREKYDSCHQIFKSLGSLMPGTNIPNGRIGIALGSGTFGTVFQVTDTASTDPLCFKIYHSHDLGDSQKVSRFRRGYAAMKQLDHPRIVKVRGLSEIPLGFFMDYIEGANSRSINPGSTQDPVVIAELLLEVAETLQHAHKREVIHRDVKPENILIKIADDGSMNAYLTDFDLSWFSSATQLTKIAEGFGSHFYAAPEQINSPHSPIAHRPTVDTYSFGQLIFFFIAGRDPLAFNPDGNGIALEQELSRKWPDSTAATEILRLYKDCTFQSADKRITNFRDICERIAQVILIFQSPDAKYDTPTFIEQTRFTLSGDVAPSTASHNFCTFRSRSNRTEVSISAVKDAPEVLGLDVTFRPNDIVMQGRSSQEARTRINARIDTALQEYVRQYDTRRSGAKSGAFEITVRIDHLKKELLGVAAEREIISCVLDQLEQT